MPQLRVLLDVIVVLGLCAMFLATFAIRVFSIPSGSMEPTLREGDILLVNALQYGVHPPQRGDIAVFRAPTAPGVPFIKRVIAVPGDTVRIESGTLYINGSKIAETFAQPPAYELAVRNYGIVLDGQPMTRGSAVIPPKSAWQSPDRVPSGYYVVLGDDRNASDDSHVWGFVPRAAFSGRAFMTIWPLGRFGILH